VLHGTRSFVLQDPAGQVAPTHSISAGLDYPSIGPEHAWLHETGRAEYAHVGDDAALDAFRFLNRREGILPALESSHAVAWLLAQSGRLPRGTVAVVNLSGRGDKDVRHASEEIARRGRP
jgi:tryptophan synthase beta chain